MMVIKMNEINTLPIPFGGKFDYIVDNGSYGTSEFLFLKFRINRNLHGFCHRIEKNSEQTKREMLMGYWRTLGAI